MMHKPYSHDMGFLGLYPDEKTIADATVTVIPFPLEATVSYGAGTAKGPLAVLDASTEVELFDEELECEPYHQFPIETLDMPIVDPDHVTALKQIETLTGAALDKKRFPLIIGGEHSLTLGTVRAAQKQFPDVSVLYFDAHSDMRLGYGGTIYSHAAVLRRVLELPGMKAVHVGCRNISEEEFGFVKKNPDKITMNWAKDMPTWDIDKMLEPLSKHVFISFDVDVFDSSIMPSTGTPEPGGINWWEAVHILRRACEIRTVVGADFSECAPIPGIHGPDFLIAKLMYKLLSYRFAAKK